MIFCKTQLQEKTAHTLHRGWKEIGRIDSIKPVEREPGVHSSNFIIETEYRRYLLKAVSEEEIAPLQEAVQIQDYCYQRKASVPRLFPRTDNGEWILCNNGCAWVLMEYCEVSPFQGKLTEVQAAADALARLHTVLRGYNGSIAVRPRYCDLSIDEIQKFERASCENSDTFHQQVVQFCKDWQKMMEQCRYPQRCSPTQPLHQDGHPGNVLFRSQDQAVIFDFAHILNHERMLAIAFSCHRFAGFDAYAVRAYLRAYHAVDPLLPEEIAAYPLFLAKECLRRIHFLLRLHFFDGDSSWNFEMERKLSVWREAMDHRDQYGEVLT